MVSVVHFGADPTGVKDSTDSINLARECAVQSNSALYFQGGTYRHCGDMDFVGGPESWYGESHRRPAIKMEPGKTGPLLRLSESMQIENMHFLGNNTPGSIGITNQLKASTYNLRNVLVEEFERGVVLEETWAGTWINLLISKCMATGLDIRNSTFNQNFIGGLLNFNGIGLNVSGGGNHNFVGLAVERNLNYGIRYSNSNLIMGDNIKNCWFERNGNLDIYLANPETILLTIEDCFLLPESNGIAVDAGKKITVAKNYFHGSVSGGDSITVGTLAQDTCVWRNHAGNQFNQIVDFDINQHNLGTNTSISP